MMNRTLALCNVFGRQGGTIHQVADVCGCNAGDLIYGESDIKSFHYKTGFYLGFTDGKIEMPVAEMRFGDLQFWLGVAQGIIERNLLDGFPIVDWDDHLFGSDDHEVQNQLLEDMRDYQKAVV